MFDGQSITQELIDAQKHLEGLTDIFNDESITRDKAEHDYRIALTKQMDRLAEVGMAATVRETYAKGIESVAELRFQRDIADSNLNATKQAIFAQNRRVDILKMMYERDISRAGNS